VTPFSKIFHSAPLTPEQMSNRQQLIVVQLENCAQSSIYLKPDIKLLLIWILYIGEKFFQYNCLKSNFSEL
jgi:hypothetical protein